MRVIGLNISARRSVVPVFLVLTGLPAAVRGAYITLIRRQKMERADVAKLPLLGLGFAGCHIAGQLVHQLGHAAAARATGYPMTGVRFEYGFAYSEYPADEPVLSDRIHLQRSFGGVAGTALFFTFTILLWLRRRKSADSFTRWLLGLMLFDGLILFFFSAVLSDGVLFVREEAWKADPLNS